MKYVKWIEREKQNDRTKTHSYLIYISSAETCECLGVIFKKLLTISIRTERERKQMTHETRTQLQNVLIY